jgi:uncharacterized protein YbaP (TraB family)
MVRRFWLAVLAVLLVVPAHAQGDTPRKTFLWEVKSGSNTLYLFGAPGLGNGDLYPVSFWAEAAYSRAQVLAVETDISDEKRIEREAADMYYPADDSLERHISRTLYDEVYDFHAQQGLPMDASNHLKPYALAIALMNKEAKTVGLTPAYDAGVYFSAKAQADGKPIGEVEGVKQALRTLTALPLPLQEEMLKAAVEQAAKGSWAEALQAEVAAWKSGDVDYYTELELKSYASMPDGAAVRHQLVEARHPAIADKLAGYLASGKVYFAVLAAAHMVGPDNLLEELQKRGFKVQRL